MNSETAMNLDSADKRPLTDVAVGIVCAPNGQVLLAQRPPGKPYAGWWEFPGGKFEPGESASEAIARELHEELGLTIVQSMPWLVRQHAYEHARVRLHFRRIEQWQGEPESREGQAFGWRDPIDAQVSPLLPATVPLMRLLTLPSVYAISAAHLLGEPTFLVQLEVALAGGLRLVQLREPGLTEAQFDQLFLTVLALCRQHGALLLINSQHPGRYWAQADGVHLRANDFDLARNLGPDHWVGASCHNQAQLVAAQAAGADFAVLGPVHATESHPLRLPLGWSGFTATTLNSGLPVYALGGLARSELEQARGYGAHGVAMIRGAFAVSPA